MKPEHDPRSQAVSPGYKSTEFWLSLLAVMIGALVAAGVFEPGSQWDKLLGLIVTLLAALGYTVPRIGHKSAVAEGAAKIAKMEFMFEGSLARKRDHTGIKLDTLPSDPNV